MAADFESMVGFPFTCGAIDGSIIEIQRPYDFEGWYCRKGYPALNMQAVVDARRRFISFTACPGSMNDKAVYNSSGIANSMKIPAGYYLVGDAGYTLSPKLLIPYPITLEMSREDSHFNYRHSQTRIKVEGAFGMLKNRFRLLKTVLSYEPDRCATMVQACLILHNMMIQFQDCVIIDEVGLGDVEYQEPEEQPASNDLGHTIRDNIRSYMMQIYE